MKIHFALVCTEHMKLKTLAYQHALMDCMEVAKFHGEELGQSGFTLTEFANVSLPAELELGFYCWEVNECETFAAALFTVLKDWLDDDVKLLKTDCTCWADGAELARTALDRFLLEVNYAEVDHGQ